MSNGIEHWGAILYENRTRNLSEVKSRMWSVMQWVVGLNLAAAASTLSDDFSDYRAAIGFGSILVSTVGMFFLIYLHDGLLKHRTILEGIKDRLGCQFNYVHGPRDQERTNWWNDCGFLFFQMELVAITGLATFAISFDYALDVIAQRNATLAVIVFNALLIEATYAWHLYEEHKKKKRWKEER